MLSRILRKIKKFLIINKTAKIVALLVALVMWIFVASSQSTAGKFPGKLPIKAVNVANGLVAIYDQQGIEIEVMAKPSVWNKLSSSSFSAYVDMEGAQVGTYEMNIQVVSNVSDVKIINKNPTKIFVRIEDVVSKKVSINQRIEGNAAEGLVAGNVEFVPSEVVITGPQSMIDNISETVAIIQLNGESADFGKDVSVKAYNDDGNEFNEVTVNPNKVKANISIVKGENNKSVGIKVNLIGNPQEGYFVSKIITTPNIINITGQSSILQSVSYLETQNVDISGLNSNFEKDVILRIPDGIALQRAEPTRVKVTVSFSENAVSRTLNPRIMTKNLDSNLRLVSYAPTDVKVTLSGKSSLLATIDPNNVVLEIDLSQKGAGSFDYPIALSAIVPIGGATVLNIVPSSIQITLAIK